MFLQINRNPTRNIALKCTENNWSAGIWYILLRRFWAYVGRQLTWENQFLPRTVVVAEQKSDERSHERVGLSSQIRYYAPRYQAWKCDGEVSWQLGSCDCRLRPGCHEQRLGLYSLPLRHSRLHSSRSHRSQRARANRCSLWRFLCWCTLPCDSHTQFSLSW